jgi:hypothetical protein
VITVADGVTEALVELTGVEAAQLGLALIKAADEAEAMVSYDQEAVS